MRPAHNHYLLHTTHSFVPPKTFSPYKTVFLAPSVPLKTFSRYKIPFYFQQGKVTENRNRERDREKRQKQETETETETGNRDSPAGGVGGAGIGSRKEGTHASGEDRRSPALPAGRPYSQTQ